MPSRGRPQATVSFRDNDDFRRNRPESHHRPALRPAGGHKTLPYRHSVNYVLEDAIRNRFFRWIMRAVFGVVHSMVMPDLGWLAQMARQYG